MKKGSLKKGKASLKSTSELKKSVSAKKPAASSKKAKSLPTDFPKIREVFYRPQREAYIRKNKGDHTEDKCVFCHSEKAGFSAESLLAYRSQHSMVILNKYPYNSGHLLVLPLRHEGDMTDLSPEEARDLMDTLQLSVRVLKSIYQPAAMNMGLNMGRVAGAGIPEHLHFHIIPRWAGDTNFFPLIADTKVVIEYPETSYQKIRDGFLKLGNS